MAILTEEPTSPTPQTQEPHKPSSQSPSSTTTAAPNPFKFWFYFTLSVSVLTLIFISLSSLTRQDSKAWFLSLPTELRQHYSKGRAIKVQITPNHPSIEVFTIQEGPISSDNVLIVHGLGCSSYSFSKIVKSLGLKGVRAVAIDLPGSGFSDKSSVMDEEIGGGVFGRLWEIYYEIQEKGLFWGFDQLVEQGYIDFEENENAVRVLKREVVKEIELGPEEMGRVLGQVIDSMGLVNVDLVLHDSALGLGANWVLENSGLVRSVTLIDATSNMAALPLWVLEVPVVREIVLGFKFVFVRVIERFCSKSGGVLDVEAHRIFLKSTGGRKSVVGMGKKMNHSLDLVEWSSSESVKGLPMQVIWSSGWSEEWSEEGRRVTGALPQATFVTHSGGRWPQEDTTDEVAESIYKFVSSLPKPIRQVVNEPIPEHIQQMFDEASQNGDHQHDHAHGAHDHHTSHGQGHDHDHAAGYMDAYGLNQGWGS